MKKIKCILVGIIAIQLLAVAIIVGAAKVQDVTLATNQVESFNDGWKLVTENGERVSIEKVPYYGNSAKNETVVFENEIPEAFCGKTMYFLSADRMLEIYVGEACIYSFGSNDQRIIGHTPGSVMVFANIPQDCAGQRIQIRGKSPYKDYAACLTDMVVGDRDVVILHFLKEKMFAFICCFGILICGIIFLIFGMVQKFSKQPAGPLFSLGLYTLTLFIYHMIETKMPMIFYGNQFLYSNLVFISLMTAPLFLEIYFYEISDSYKKGMGVLLVISCVNIIGQLLLQGLNLLDFMDMSPISHGLLGVIIAFVLIQESRSVIGGEKFDISYVGIFIMGVCGAFDLLRNQWVKVGDFGKYSRIGLLVLGIIMIVSYLKDFVGKQIQFADNQKTEEFSAEIIRTLVAAIDAKDIYTKGHSTRVAEYSVLLANTLGWEEERIKKIRYMALLHDVGKIGIPDRVLNKADRLTDDEYELIKSHTTIGADILSGVSSLSNMNLVAKHHHERFDGKGYPEGLGGKGIPEEARLVGIVDAYDAMSSDRAYRKALPKEVIRNELVKGKGTQFDPEMADVFIKLFDEGGLDEVYTDYKNENRTLDVSAFVDEMLANQMEPGATKMDVESINKVYQYINGLHERHGMEYHTILITLVWEDGVTMEEVGLAMKAMEYSIIQSLRKVDVVTRISESQYLIVLTEAHTQNLQMILERIFTSFYSNSQNTRIKPTYEVTKTENDKTN